MCLKGTALAAGQICRLVSKALIFQLVLLATPSFQYPVSANSATVASRGFPLGIISPCTSFTQDLLGCSALVDLDVRKHTEPELIEQYGPPIVNISHVHPELRVDFRFGTDDSSVTTGMKTALTWMQGSDGDDPVIGIVGPIFSPIVGPIASTAAVFDIPQVSIGGADASLANPVLYPYLLRIPPADTVRGVAVWSWMEDFQIASMSVLVVKTPGAESAAQALADMAFANGQPGRVSSTSVPSMPREEDLDLPLLFTAVDIVKSTGSKVVAMIASDRGTSTSLMYVFEQRGMLYSATYQFLWPTAVSSIVNRELKPSFGLPVGLQIIDVQFRGSAYPSLVEMWGTMAPEDVYGPDAVERYRLDRMQVLPSEAARPMLTEESFARLPYSRCSSLLDAAYTFVVAINNLLNAGTAGQDIAGEQLLKALKSATFAGATGDVMFDANGGRLGVYILDNALQNGTLLETRAMWRASESKWVLTSEKPLIWAGGINSTLAPAALSACVAGRQWDSNAGFCVLCPQNFYSSAASSADGGQLDRDLGCIPCLAGEVGNAETGATACIPCRNGTARAPDATECVPCPRGTFAAGHGQSACQDCQVGTFGPEEEASSCHVCGDGRLSEERFTTMSVKVVNGIRQYVYEEGAVSSALCGCDIGYRKDLADECVACTGGMHCLGMGDVRILPGFFAEATGMTKELRVYRCHGNPDRCVGGLPGETCAPGREGLACSSCKDGKTPSSSGGTCRTCGDADHLPAIAVTVAAVVALIVVYYFVDRQNPAIRSTRMLICAVALGQSLTVIQQLGVVSHFTLKWEEPLKSAMHAVSALTFDLDRFNFNCISSQGPAESFAVKVCIIYMGIVMLFVIHACFVVFCYQNQWQSRMHVLIGMIGTLFMVLYLAVTSTLLQPFQCVDHPHPNNHWTVRSFPGVICWEAGEHVVMLIISVISFLTVPLAYLALCVAIVWKFPAKMREGDARFMQAFSFLFFRFRASCYGFVLAQTLRSFIIALVLVIPDIVTQLIVLQVTLLAGFTASLYALPWRVATGNIFDLASSAGMLMFVLLVSLFIEETDKRLSNISAFSVILLVCLLAMLPIGIGRALYLKLGRKRKPYDFFLTHHKAASGAYTRLLKIIIVERRRLRSGAVFLDADNLDNLDKLYDYVGNDTSTLVVICTSQIFSRPWCVGEICTAMLKRVNAVVVALPGATLPSNADGIDRHVESITDWKALTENGIQQEIVHEALGWISKQPVISVPQSASNAVLTFVVDKLVAGRSADLTQEHLKEVRVDHPEGSSIMIYDATNLEAGAAANILWKMLIRVMATNAQDIPRPLDRPELPARAAKILFICTRGIFKNDVVVSMLNVIPSSTTALLPVVCEASFHFPSRPHEGAAAMSRAATENCRGDALTFAEQLFKEIAITFFAQVASDEALELAANAIALRLRAKKVRSLTNPTDDDNVSRSPCASVQTMSSGSAKEQEDEDLMAFSPRLSIFTPVVPNADVIEIQYDGQAYV